MSNNKIQIIHGKAYHKVPYVERLILNHNELTVDASHHPRFAFYINYNCSFFKNNN